MLRRKRKEKQRVSWTENKEKKRRAQGGVLRVDGQRELCSVGEKKMGCSLCKVGV